MNSPEAWGIPEPDQEELDGGNVRPEVLADPRYQSMEDVEMVLRFFAHRQRESASRSVKLRQYLDQYWELANKNFSESLVDQLGATFTATIDLVMDVLGERAFYIRRDRDSGRVWVPRPTLLAYDCVMSAFSQHLDNAEVLRDRRDAVNVALEYLYDKNASDFDGRKTDAKDVQKRDRLMTDMLSEVVRKA